MSQGQERELERFKGGMAGKCSILITDQRSSENKKLKIKQIHKNKTSTCMCATDKRTSEKNIENI